MAQSAVHSPIPSAKERTPRNPSRKSRPSTSRNTSVLRGPTNRFNPSFKKFLGIIDGNKPIGDITKADCRQYKETLLKSVGIATANKNLHSLSHLWNWAIGQGFVQEGSTSPVAGLSDQQEASEE